MAQPRKKGRKRRILRNICLVIVLFCAFLLTTLWFLGRPNSIEYIANALTAGKDWKVELKEANFEPLQRRLTIAMVSAENLQQKSKFTAHDLNLRFSLLSLLRGKVVINKLSSSKVLLATTAQTKKIARKKQKLDLKRLFLLRNLVIKNAHIKQLSYSIGSAKNLAINNVHLVFDHSFFGKSQLDFNTASITFSSKEKTIAQTTSLHLRTASDLNQWQATFPYINDLTGSIATSNTDLEGTKINKLLAELKYKDSILSLSPLEITVGKNTLAGTLKANTSKEDFVVDINIPEPISVPHLGKASITFESGGSLAGKINLTGKGFIPSLSTGSAKIDLSHRFHSSPDHNNSLLAELKWKKGVISFQEATLQSGEAFAKLHGTIQVPQKHLAINFSGANFPLENVMQNFVSRDLKKIFGKTDFVGSFTGWGKNFSLSIDGSTKDGGWKDIAAEKIVSNFKLTYKKLKLHSKILQRDKQTGEVSLNIDYGNNLADGTRKKHLNLKGSIENYDLGASLKQAYGLSGIGNASITLSGPQKSFTGKVNTLIETGDWHGLAFDEISSEIDLSRHKITFDKVKYRFAHLEQNSFAQALFLDIEPGKFNLHGNPFPDTTVNMTYTAADKQWRFHPISLGNSQDKTAANVTGSIVSGGDIDLKIYGTLNLSALNPFAPIVREAGGDVKLDLQISGQLANPYLAGKIDLTKNIISPRIVRLPMEEATGTIHFKGKKISFEDISAKVEEGKVNINGSITHKNMKVVHSDLNLQAREFTFRAPDGKLRLELNGEVTLRGNMPSPLLDGDVTIIDARYTKDFKLLDALQESKLRAEQRAAESEVWFNPKLNLIINNTGEFLIKNNIGNFSLLMDIETTGTRLRPKVNGTIDIVEGEVLYLGMLFDINKGFIEFRAPDSKSYLEVSAQQEIGVYNINLFLHGPTDNLALDLSATSPSGPLEKRDVISLIAIGLTQKERQEAKQNNQGAFSAQAVGAQLSTVIERPLARLAHIDTFRLEAADPSTQTISRVYVGKQISDRLSIDFATDINTEEAEQTVTTEYLITDNILMKAYRGNAERVGLRGVIRFRSR